MIKIVKGYVFNYQGKEHIVEKIIDLDTVLAREMNGSKEKTIKISEIDTPAKPDMKEQASIDMIKEEYFDIAKKRFEVIKPFTAKIRNNKAKQEERAAQYGITYQTLINWLNLYRDGGNLLSLLPQYDKRGGKDKSRLPEEVEKIMENLINERYLTKQRIPITKLYKELVIILKRENLYIPNEATLRRRIKKIDKSLVFKKRYGRNSFLNKLKPSKNQFESDYPLEIIQIDHTPLDIIVVDEKHRKPINRPYITVALDIYSRMVYGFYLTLDAPSFYSVGQTLFMGLSSKEQYLKDLGIDGKWKIFGLPKSLTIHTDNAAEFRSANLKKFCEVFGINMDFRPRGAPYYGGHVERFIGTLNGELHTLPGTTFSNAYKRGEYNSDKKAVFTLKELEKYITEWIVNYYHKEIHSSLGMSPEDKFMEGILGTPDKPGIGLPAMLDKQELEFAKLSLLPFEYRTIQKDGVSLFGIKYYSEILISFIQPTPANKKKESYLFKYDPKDLSIIYFYHPIHKKYYPIHYKKMGFPVISKWELDNAKKYLAEQRIKNYSEDILFKTIEDLKKIEEESTEKTKYFRRKKESRKAKPLTQKTETDDKNKTTSKTEKIDISKKNIKNFEIDF